MDRAEGKFVPSGATRSRRGSAIMWTANIWVLLTICLGAFAVDLGKYLYSRAVIRDTIDAAALAASAALETGADPQAAALALVSQNNRGSVVVDSSKVSVISGSWNAVSKTFTANGWPANAVRVTLSQPYAGGVFSRPSSKIDADSVAHFSVRDITLVLDFSGSMLDNGKSVALQTAVNDFCNVVEDVGNGKDRVAMYHYSDTPVLDNVYSSNLTAVRTSINAATFAGATNIGDGLKSGVDYTKAYARSSAEPMVIVLTDGLANRPTGVDPIAYAQSQANRALGFGIPVYTVSFGTDADRSLMQYIADTTSGVHYHVDDNTPTSAADLSAAFREIAAAHAAHFVK